MDPLVLPESVKIAGWLGGAAFTVWIFERAWALYDRGHNRRNGKTDGKTRCIESVPWALHDKKSDNMIEILSSMNEEKEKQTVAFTLIAESGKRQEELLEKIADGVSRQA